MLWLWMVLLGGLALGLARSAEGAPWTIFIVNDNCPDYTWGFTEEQTRQAFADIVAAHLDQMTRTDAEAPGNRDHYTMAVTQEALCFVERYPERKEEVIRRLREGRLCLSPYLNNTLWGLQSIEASLRTFYPARRLERDWGIPIDIAEHIEEPNLPWGTATLLAGCGVRWVSVAYLDYDATLKGLESPPLFLLEGPDGSRVRAVLDKWASQTAGYWQGGALLKEPGKIAAEWLPHYRGLGESYPLTTILASGTHSDISPTSGEQAAGFADAIRAYNAVPGQPALLHNATLAEFCHEVDAVEAARPFLPVVRGCFGHSWEAWAVSLAAYAAKMREAERDYLSTEALLARALLPHPELAAATQADRERAEWCWAMLGDHAWNGTSPENKDHNAGLRRAWVEELSALTARLVQQTWPAISAPAEAGRVLFNGLSLPRAGLVSLEAPEGEVRVLASDAALPSQVVPEEGGRRLYFVSPAVAGFGFASVSLAPGQPEAAATVLRATPTELESPCYRLRIDPARGGISSLVLKATGTELLAPEAGRVLGETVYWRGEERALRDVHTEVAAIGPVLARVRITGAIDELRLITTVTVYADLDRVDLDYRVHKPVRAEEERLCHLFPVLTEGGVLRAETPAAVVRPRPQPEGDLLPGADARRLAVQGFIDVARGDGTGVMVAPWDAFLLRLDLGPLAFEALGNDQNYREVISDQHRVTDFRFRYSLRGYAGEYSQTRAVNWSRSVTTPLLVAAGVAPGPADAIAIDPARAVATCLKPAEPPAAGLALRVWETAGQSGPLVVSAAGYRQAFRTDLLERDLEELPVRGGKVSLPLAAYGLAGLRLVP